MKLVLHASVKNKTILWLKPFWLYAPYNYKLTQKQMYWEISDPTGAVSRNVIESMVFSTPTEHLKANKKYN